MWPFNPSLRLLLATNGLIMLASAMLAPIYALFVEEIGGDLLVASITGGVFALAAGITTLFAGRLADRVRHDENIVIAGYLLMAAGFFGFSFVHNLWGLLMFQAIIGIGEAVYSPAFDSLYGKHLDKKKEGVEWGAWESSYYFLAVVGSIGGGLIATHFGFDALFYIMAALCLAGALYMKFAHTRLS